MSNEYSDISPPTGMLSCVSRHRLVSLTSAKSQIANCRANCQKKKAGQDGII
jgi:hypothetical protein